VNAGAQVLANVGAPAAERVRSYGVAETIDHTTISLDRAVQRAYPYGIDVLIDLVSNAESFAALASLVRPGGTAVTTQYVADPEALDLGDPRCELCALRDERDLGGVAAALVDGHIVAPPITRIKLEEVPTQCTPSNDHPDGNTVLSCDYCRL
jgi:threonine dehydrogenase-like Zn-dependent dehydrogenase